MRSLLFGTALLLASWLALAADREVPAGVIKRSAGRVLVDYAGEARQAAVGTPVYVGDRIRTGVDGAVGITLSDDTLLTAGPNSTLLINEFVFNSTTHEGSMLSTLYRGTLNVVSGLIARQAPQNVRFRTPTVVLGIRGTEFILETRGDEE